MTTSILGSAQHVIDLTRLVLRDTEGIVQRILGSGAPPTREEGLQLVNTINVVTELLDDIETKIPRLESPVYPASSTERQVGQRPA